MDVQIPLWSVDRVPQKSSAVESRSGSIFGFRVASILVPIVTVQFFMPIPSE